VSSKDATPKPESKENVAPVEKNAKKEKNDPKQNNLPKEKNSPKENTSMKEKSLKEDTAEKEMTPVKENIPVKENTPVKEDTPVKEKTPVQENSPVREINENELEKNKSTKTKDPVKEVQKEIDPVPVEEVTPPPKENTPPPPPTASAPQTPEEEPVIQDGKKSYSREFLMKFKDNPLALNPPKNLPGQALDILKKNRSMSSERSMSMMGSTDFTPNYMRHGNSKQYSSSMIRSTNNSMKGKRPIKVIEAKVTSNILKTTANAWTRAAKDKVDTTEKVKREVRALLNKLCPEVFEKVYASFEEIFKSNEDKIEPITEVLYSKAIIEKYYSGEYARLCKRLILCYEDEHKRGIRRDDVKNCAAYKFRSMLLEIFEFEFQKKLPDDSSKKNKKSEVTQPGIADTDKEKVISLKAELETCTDNEKKEGLQTELEYYEAQLRSKYIGMTKFYGELYMHDLIHSKMVMKKLVLLVKELNKPEISEVLCTLFLSTAQKLYKSASNDEKKELKEVVSKMKSRTKVEKDSRLKFKILNVTEYFDSNFVAVHKSQKQVGPSTIKQVHENMKIEHENTQAEVSQALNTMRPDRMRRGDRGSNGLHTENTESWNSILRDTSTRGNQTLRAINNRTNNSSNDSEPVLGGGHAFSKWSRGSSGGSNSNNRNMNSSSSNNNSRSSNNMAPAKSNRFSAFGLDESEEMPETHSFRPTYNSNRRPNDMARGPGGRSESSQRMPYDSSSRFDAPASRNQGSYSSAPPPPPALNPPQQPPVEDEELPECAGSSFRELISLKDMKEATEDVVQKIGSHRLAQYIKFMLLDIGEVSSKDQPGAVETIINFLSHLHKKQILTLEQIDKAFSLHIAELPDWVCDYPNIGKICGTVLGGLVSKGIIKLENLWSKVKHAEEIKLKSDLYLSALKRISTENTKSKLKLLSWHCLGLDWKTIIGTDDVKSVHEKLSAYNLAFLHSPSSSNITDSEYVNFIKGCAPNVQNRSEMKDFFIGYLRNIYHPNDKIITNVDFDELCIQLDAIKLQLGITVETLIGFQAICLLNDNNPNNEFFAILLDAGMQTESVNDETLDEFETTKEPYVGLFATYITKFRNNASSFETEA